MTQRPIFLEAADIDRLISPADLIDAAERSFKAISSGEARQPPRTLLHLERGGFGLMPGEVRDPAVFGIKLVSLFPGAAAQGLSSHQGLVVLFDGKTGAPRAVIEAGHLTALRTAAASVVSTRVLARPDAAVLGLIGAGEQARAHLALFRATTPLRKAIVFARRPEAARAFAELHAAVTIAQSIEALCAQADIICTLTKAAEPILFGRWLRPGQHIVAAGSSVPSKREIDEETVTRSSVFVDWREGAEQEAGDIAAAIRAGLCGPDVVRGEVGNVLLGRLQGRRDKEEITLFKSLGVAAEDLVLAETLLGRVST